MTSSRPPPLPAVAPPLSTSRPHFTDTEFAAVARVMQSGYLGMGPETRAFEAELTAYLGGNRHVVCANTGTSALHLAVAALGLPPGAEVLVPTFTFVATFQAIVAAGAHPRLCDVDPADGLLDLAHARRRLRPGVAAIMPVHFAGNASGIGPVLAFAAEHGLHVIEDAAHAFGSRDRGRVVGSFGDLTCFSFDPIKNITCGEGGAVVTASAALAERLRTLRNLGLESDGHRFADGAPDVCTTGWRFHMPDLAAALGRAQLARFDRELRPHREQLARHYRAGLAAAKQIMLLTWNEGTVPHIMPVRVTGGARDALRERLASAGFETRVHYRPGHHFRAFADAAPFPGAEQLFREILSLPLHGAVSTAQVAAVNTLCCAH